MGKPALNPDPYSDVPEAQNYLREGVEGFGEQLRPHILKDIGDTLGGLNSIGGLRSGGTEVALGDITEKYAAQVGAFAKEATAGGLSAGLEARRQRFREDQAKQARKAGLMKAIGSVLGAGIGFLAAGPPGAVAGAGVGGKAAGDLSGGGSSYTDYEADKGAGSRYG